MSFKPRKYDAYHIPESVNPTVTAEDITLFLDTYRQKHAGIGEADIEKIEKELKKRQKHYRIYKEYADGLMEDNRSIQDCSEMVEWVKNHLPEGTINHFTQENLDRHLKTNTEKDISLKQGLRLLLQKLSSNSLSKDTLTGYGFKLNERIAECTAGFYGGVQDLLMSFQTPQDLDEMLYQVRCDIVEKTALKLLSYRYRRSILTDSPEQFYRANEPHTKNAIYKFAHLHYGTVLDDPLDPYGGALEHDVIESKLKEAFEAQYNLLNVIHKIEEQLQNQFLGFKPTQDNGFGIYGSELEGIEGILFKMFPEHMEIKQLVAIKDNKTAFESQLETKQSQLEQKRIEISNELTSLRACFKSHQRDLQKHAKKWKERLQTIDELSDETLLSYVEDIKKPRMRSVDVYKNMLSQLNQPSQIASLNQACEHLQLEIEELQKHLASEQTLDAQFKSQLFIQEKNEELDIDIFKEVNWSTIRGLILESLLKNGSYQPDSEEIALLQQFFTRPNFKQFITLWQNTSLSDVDRQALLDMCPMPFNHLVTTLDHLNQIDSQFMVKIKEKMLAGDELPKDTKLLNWLIATSQTSEFKKLSALVKNHEDIVRLYNSSTTRKTDLLRVLYQQHSSLFTMENISQIKNQSFEQFFKLNHQPNQAVLSELFKHPQCMDEVLSFGELNQTAKDNLKDGEITQDLLDNLFSNKQFKGLELMLEYNQMDNLDLLRWLSAKLNENPAQVRDKTFQPCFLAILKRQGLTLDEAHQAYQYFQAFIPAVKNTYGIFLCVNHQMQGHQAQCNSEIIQHFLEKCEFDGMLEDIEACRLAIVRKNPSPSEWGYHDAISRELNQLLSKLYQARIKLVEKGDLDQFQKTCQGIILASKSKIQIYEDQLPLVRKCINIFNLFLQKLGLRAQQTTAAKLVNDFKQRLNEASQPENFLNNKPSHKP